MRRRRRRAMLIAVSWAALLVAAVTVGYGAITD
jgi:predicted nucleic acid-binding Zn ribbon protein